MQYEILSRSTGASWGHYEAETPEDAILAMLTDGGEEDPTSAKDEFEAIPEGRPPYAVVVISQSSRNFDGSPIIERDCGHKHRTLTGAHRCKARLTAPNGDGSYRADFYRAEVRHADGSRLSTGEADDVAHVELETLR